MKPKTQEQLLHELEDLRARLDEAEDTLRAIRSGEVDALVVSGVGGEQIYTLNGAERPYRIMIENMNEGALNLGFDGTIFYCNLRFADMVKTPIEKIIGNSIYLFVKPEEKKLVEKFVRQASSSNKTESFLRDTYGTLIPVLLSLNDFGNQPPLSICIVVTDITERKQAEEKIKVSLLEKEILLKEIHHRVKNNLQVISSLLRLQGSYLQDEKAIIALEESIGRIETMTSIHTQLYQSQDLARVDFSAFIHKLISNIRQSYGRAESSIEINVDAGEISLGIDNSVPCGLILNELISNAMKHAFPEGKEGEINVRMQLEGNQVVITVKDNGIGFSESIDFTKIKSLGLNMVSILVKQMNGKIDMQLDGGTIWTITFTLKNERK